uniref:MYND-type domain-containing protein n=1 Tax=Cacopsylla melanoneura TaxID=428564 RepID=A0A8D8VNE4_9HEMI
MIEEQRISISLGTLKQLSLNVEVPVLESEGSIERKIRTVHLLAKYGKRITESPIAAVRRRKRAARIESSSSDEDELPLPKKRNLTKDIDHDDDSHDDEKRKENRDDHDKSDNNNQPMERAREIEEADVGEQKGTVDNSNKNKSAASASKEVDLSLRKSDVEEFLRSSAYRKYQLFNIQDAIKTIAETLLKVISLRTAIKQGTGDKDAKEAEKVALCQTISLDVFDIFDKFKGRQDNQFRVIIGFTVYQVYEQFRILWERNKTGKDVQFLWCKMLFNTCLRQSHFAHSSVIEFISKMNHEDYELVKKLTQELANGETSNNKKQPNKRRKSKDLQVDSKKTGLDRLDKPAETDSAPKSTPKSYKTVVGNSEDKSNISQSNKTVENSREMNNISVVTNKHSEPNIVNTCGEINDALKTVTVINTLKKPIDTTSNANSTKSPSSIKTIIREKDLVAINRLGINNSIDHHFKKSLDTTTSTNSIESHLNIDQTKSTCNDEAETSNDQTSNVFIDKTNHANNATISIVTKDKPNNATSNDDTINECTISIVNNVENSNETSDKTRIVTSNAKNDTISTAANIDRSNNVIDKTRLVINSALTDKTSNAIEDNESDDEIEFLSCVKSTSKPKACVAPHQSTNSDLPIPGDGVSSIQIVNVRGGLISYSCILYTGCSDLLQFSDPTRNIVSSKMATALSLPLTPQFNSILATFPVLGVLKQVEKDMNVNSMGIDAEQISIMYKIFFINLVKYYKAWIQCVQDIDKRNEINSYFTCISSLNEDDIESMPDNLAEITADKMSTFVCLKEIVKSKLNIGGTRPCTHAQYTVNAKSSRCQELILIKNSMIVAYKRQTTYEPLRANNMTVCKLPRVKSSLSDDALPEVCLFSLITSVNMLLLFIPDTRTELRHTLTLQHDLAIRTFLASHNIEIALKDKEVARQINIRDKIEHMETLAEYITRVQEESSFAFAQQLSKSSNKSRSLPHWPGDPPPTSQPQSRPPGSVTTAPGAPSAASSASGLTTKFIVLPGSNDIVPHTGTTIKPMPDLAPINYVPPGQGSPVVSSGGPLVNIGPLINIVRPMNPAVPIVSGGTPQTSNTGTLRYHLTTPRGPPNTHTTGSHTPSSTTQHLRTLRFVPYEMNPNNAAGGSKEASKLRSMMPKPYGSTAPNSASPVPTSSSETSNSTSTAADSSFATPYALSTAPYSSSTATYSSSTAPYASFTEPYASSTPRRPLSSPTSSAQNNPQLTPPPHYRPTTSQGNTGSPQTVSQKPNSSSRAGPGTGPRAVRGGRSPSSRGRGGRGIRLVDPTRLMASHLIAQQDSGGTGGGGVGGDVALGNLLEDLLQDVPCASPSSSNVTHCASCGAPAELQCSGCNNLCYCSAECQLRHWESAHSTQCALSS